MTHHWGLRAENRYLTHNIGIWGYQRGKKSSGWSLLRPFKIVWVIWLNMNGEINRWKGNINQHNQQSHVETSFWTLRSEQYTTNNICLICGFYHSKIVIQWWSNASSNWPSQSYPKSASESIWIRRKNMVVDQKHYAVHIKIPEKWQCWYHGFWPIDRQSWSQNSHCQIQSA